IGIAQVKGDAAILVAEFRDRVEWRHVDETLDRRVQAAASDHQQRKARTVLLIADADSALLVECHAASPYFLAKFVLQASTGMLLRRADETEGAALFQLHVVASRVTTPTSR